MSSISIITTALLLLSFQAQESDPPMPYEEKAGEILSEAGKLIQQLDALHLTFAYTAEDAPHSIDDETDGYLYSSGDKYYMKVGQNHFISDGQTAWSYLEDVNEVHISPAEDTQQALTPTSILSDFRDDFRVKWIREESHNGRDTHVIDLTPEEPHAFYKYRVGIDMERKRLVYTIAYDRDGGEYRYEVLTYNTDPEIPEGTFSFDPEEHPDIEVVDLR